VTKIDLFRVFHKHGKLAQISIKQAYGFVQYQDAESCARALEAEQAVAIRGRRIRKYTVHPILLPRMLTMPYRSRNLQTTEKQEPEQ
jgi:RNA recognition motif-containing protein